MKIGHVVLFVKRNKLTQFHIYNFSKDVDTPLIYIIFWVHCQIGWRTHILILSYSVLYFCPLRNNNVPLINDQLIANILQRPRVKLACMRQPY